MINFRLPSKLLTTALLSLLLLSCSGESSNNTSDRGQDGLDAIESESTRIDDIETEEIETVDNTVGIDNTNTQDPVDSVIQNQVLPSSVDINTSFDPD